jgi:CSLREA domain-containing protein
LDEEAKMSVRLLGVIGASLLLTLAFATALGQSTVYLPLVYTPLTVTTTEDELNNDGDCSLREAIQAANTGSQVDACQIVPGSRNVILIPAGVYTLTLAGGNEDDNTTGDFDITNDMVLYGVGAGQTILYGNASDRVLHIFTGTHVSLTGVTITNGRTPDGADSTQETRPGENAEPGGAIANFGAFTLTQSIVFSNSTGIGGRGYLRIIPRAIGTNGGDGGPGGALYNAGTFVARAVQFRNNHTSPGGDAGYYGYCSGRAGAGGAIYNLGTVLLVETSLTVNSTPQGYFCSSLPFFSGGTGANGGGIMNEGTLMLYQSTVAANSASDGSARGGTHGGAGTGGNGGGIYNQSVLILVNSTVSGNRAGDGYGSFWGWGTGGYGGGIANFGTVQLALSTIADNRAGVGQPNQHSQPGIPGEGGGLYNEGTVEIKSTIIASNTVSASAAGADCRGTVRSYGVNLFQHLQGCIVEGDMNNLVDVDPQLFPLGDYGGVTPMHALSPGSVAIDRGSCTDIAGNAVPTDQRSVPRPLGNTCDIGAYEAFP